MELDTDDGHGAGRLQRTLSIRGVPAQALTEAWRRPDIQREVMAEFADLRSGDAARMRWQVHLPVLKDLEIETREIAHAPGARVRHASAGVGRSDVAVETELSLRQGPADRGIEATLSLHYSMPGGVLADVAMQLFGAAPDVLAGRVLRRFKARMEAGEIPTLARNPAARDDD